MDVIEDLAYWIAFAHLPRWRTEKINRLIMDIRETHKITFDEFFNDIETTWDRKFHLNSKQFSDLLDVRMQLPEINSLAERLMSNGFTVIPFWSKKYPETLMSNLKMKYSPTVLYIKGDHKLFKMQSVAIIGSRKAAQSSLRFTEVVAKKYSEKQRVVVSGFAKGVDRLALDSALKYGGQSIIVLPQGIMTFDTGLKRYENQLLNGDILVLSTFFPTAPWSIGLAMGRNTYIYGLAKEIFVAESDEKGGTWSGVSDGLRKGRKIYVRSPDLNEINANDLLILKGAIPVDNNGNTMENNFYINLERQVKTILSKMTLTAKQIKELLHVEIDTQKLSRLLSNMDSIVVEKGNNVDSYYLKRTKQIQYNLFDDDS